MLMAYARLATAGPRTGYKIEKQGLLQPQRQLVEVKIPSQSFFGRYFLQAAQRLFKDSKNKDIKFKECSKDDKENPKVCSKDDDHKLKDCSEENEAKPPECAEEDGDKPTECPRAPKMPCCEDPTSMCIDPCEEDEDMEEISAHVGSRCAQNPCAKLKDPCEGFIRQHIGRPMKHKDINQQQPVAKSDPIK